MITHILHCFVCVYLRRNIDRFINLFTSHTHYCSLAMTDMFHTWQRMNSFFSSALGEMRPPTQPEVEDGWCTFTFLLFIFDEVFKSLCTSASLIYH